MAQHIRDFMTPTPVTLSTASTLVDAAIAMRDFNVGAILVFDNEQLYGIVTDRDIVIRGIANGNYPATTTLGEVCSRELATITPSDTVAKALQLMRGKAVRQLPVIDNGQLVGIVSMDDLGGTLEPHAVHAERCGVPPSREG
jgi:signal-transduction protein with cAMP-binding, CBS, and nucleotidyltransferase domain